MLILHIKVYNHDICMQYYSSIHIWICSNLISLYSTSVEYHAYTDVYLFQSSERSLTNESYKLQFTFFLSYCDEPSEGFSID